ncbi:uncharacterized protein [Kogia breviceps]|uniref:uncharacterized protein n=1 Tax=Kogia breviceps TaxID=27615 RepID=UPI0034D34DAF
MSLGPRGADTGQHGRRIRAMSGRRSRARKPRARRTGRARKTTGQQGPEAKLPPPDPRGPRDEAGVAPAGHVTGSKLPPRGQPRVARPERPQVAKRPEKATALGSELVPVPAADTEGCGAGGLTLGRGPEPPRLREVQLRLAQEQLLLEERRRWVQLQMQLWQEEPLWLQQLREEQAWVQVEGLELAMALEQLRCEGLEALRTQDPHDQEAEDKLSSFRLEVAKERMA